MNLLEKTGYQQEELEVAAYAKALAHPARIAILSILLNRQACICGDIVSELPLAQSTVSQHLKELKAAGLIKGEIEGTSVCYCIDEVVWKKAMNMLQDFFKRAENRNSCCQ